MDAFPIVRDAAKREWVLSDAEVAKVWLPAGEASAPFGPIIRLLILTGQRRGEVAGMAWREVSDDLTIWSLPAERTKNGPAHNVPLSAPARSLLKSFVPEDGARERPTRISARGSAFAGWSKAKVALGSVTPSGPRQSSGATPALERARFAPHSGYWIAEARCPT